MAEVEPVEATCTQSGLVGSLCCTNPESAFRPQWDARALHFAWIDYLVVLL